MPVYNFFKWVDHWNENFACLIHKITGQNKKIMLKCP